MVVQITSSQSIRSKTLISCSTSLFLLLGRCSFCFSTPHFGGSEVVMPQRFSNEAF